MKRGSRIRAMCCAVTVMVALAVTYLHANVAQQQQDSGQQSGDKKKKDKDKGKPTDQQDQQQQQGQQQSQPAPLFQGKSNLKSSRQTKDSGTLGFNGVGPNGEVDKKLLEASVNGDDDAKAEELANIHIKRSEVDAFVAQGGLKAGGK